MSLQIRGGVPHVFRDTATVVGRRHNLPFTAMFVLARNQGANVVRMYFTEDDYDADDHFVVLPVAAAAAPHGEWAAPVESGVLWFRAVGGNSAIEVTAFQRRG